MTQIITSTFKAPWLLANPHLQTCLAILAKRSLKSSVFWEELSLPDGDFVDLAWVGNQAEGPIALLIPGLEGGLHASYVVSLIEPLLKAGWRVVVVHFRCCSGRINNLSRAYSANDSDDLQMVAASLRMQNPGVNVVGIGFSLGASVLLKTLESLSELYFPNDYITAAVGISTPFDLAATLDYIPEFYQWHLLRSMKAKVKEKIKAGFKMPISLDELSKIKNLRKFDALITAPLHEFSSVDDYYAASTCGSNLHKIKVKTLLIHALDDPLVPPTCLPAEKALGENMCLELSQHGGHLGFLSSKMPWGWRHWLTQRVMEFIKPYS